MPTYDYKCTACGHRFERVQAMKDQPLRECDACGGPVKRLIGSGAGFILKGTGWYCTDFKAKGAAAPAKAGSAPAPAPASATAT
ncbi:MAG: FmdB family zinc ribbon protein [Lentisphaeria bacterium]|jgi:putative FmdB family regulatory protein